VQLFDTSMSLASAVCQYVSEGLERDENVLLVVTQRHWELIRSTCLAVEIDLTAARMAGRLVVRDADMTLASFMKNDLPDPAAFHASVGALVRQLRGAGRPVRAYGEMVDALARAGEFEGALRLEELWNALLAEQPMTLFCGYMAEHFGNPRDARALQHICQTHSHAHAQPGDVLGTFLLKTARAC
jgi:hypothetical protein